MCLCGVFVQAHWAPAATVVQTWARRMLSVRKVRRIREQRRDRDEASVQVRERERVCVCVCVCVSMPGLIGHTFFYGGKVDVCVVCAFVVEWSQLFQK